MGHSLTQAQNHGTSIPPWAHHLLRPHFIPFSPPPIKPRPLPLHPLHSSPHLTINMFQYSYPSGSCVDPNLNLNNHFFAASSPPSSNDYTCIPDHTVTVNPFYSSPVSSPCDFLDFHGTEHVHRVYSTGDLQEVIAAAATGRVGRYSAEERKERIERYRSKRNHRNFHKKITYACRKTLADSRPRVRGRFARNGESEIEALESSETSFECYSYGTCDNGGSRNTSENSTDGLAGRWWKEMQAALTTTDEEECCYDADIWASLDSAFSVNLLS